MITLGFTYNFSDLVVNGTAFPYPTTYLYLPTAGDVVYQTTDGSYQWIQSAAAGYHPIAATRVVATETVNGVSRNTTAANMVYCCSRVY